MKPENKVGNEIDKFTDEKLSYAQKYCYDALQDVQSQNEPKLVELLRSVSSQGKDCSHHFDQLKLIEECLEPFSKIENEHTANGTNILSLSTDQLGGCVHKAIELYKFTKDLPKFNIFYQNCLSTFKDTITAKMGKLIDDDLKRLKELK